MSIIRILLWVVQGAVLSYIGYGWTTWQYWAILLSTFFMLITTIYD